MIGTSAISGDEATFHALNSKKKKEGPIGLFIVKNGSKISSVCNDVVGDVSGIISGSIGAVLAISISSTFGFSQTLVSIVIAAIISSFTVGGKAIFKPIAVHNANNIIIRIAKIFSIFKRGK
jgi:CBS domain containing-hemolysin-like protein